MTSNVRFLPHDFTDQLRKATTFVEAQAEQLNEAVRLHGVRSVDEDAVAAADLAVSLMRYVQEWSQQENMGRAVTFTAHEFLDGLRRFDAAR